MVVAFLVVLIGFSALAIDIGHLYTARNELQDVADAAALAGARYMGEVYSGLQIHEMGTHIFTKEEIFTPINAVALNNTAGNQPISIDINDVRVGLWKLEESKDDILDSNVTLTGPDAVRVIARRDSSINNPLTAFFARILGIDTMNVTSEKAVAALTGPSFVPEEELTTPFGISQLKNCADPTVTFNPTATCGGWHDFIWSSNANDMGTTALRIIRDHVTDVEGLWNGNIWLANNWPALKWNQLNKSISDLLSIPVPDNYSTGDSFNFQGGNIASLFNGSYIDTTKPYSGNQGTITGTPEHSPAPAFALFDYFRYRDHDGDNSVWTATIPIYKDGLTCENPNGSREILGFAKAVITSPAGPPSTLFNVVMDCNLVVDTGRGGGTTYGNLKGKIPNLVR